MSSKSAGKPGIVLHEHDASEQEFKFKSSALKHSKIPSRNSSEASDGDSRAPYVNFFSITTIY